MARKSRTRLRDYEAWAREAEKSHAGNAALTPVARLLESEIDAECLPYFTHLIFNETFSSLSKAWGRCKDAQEAGVDLDDAAQAEVVSIINNARLARAGA